MFRISSSGDHNKTAKALKRLIGGDIYSELDRYGRMGVAALAAATPAESGLTAQSWGYRVIRNPRWPGIEWYNTNTVRGGPSVAVLIQYGHGTGTGGYVPGRDFINPVMQPIFDQIADNVWKKVKP